MNAFYEEKVFLKDLYPAWCLTYGPDIGGKTQSVQFFRGDAESRESRFRLQNGDVGVAGFRTTGGIAEASVGDARPKILTYWRHDDYELTPIH